MANINKIKLSGTTYNIQDLSAAKTVELTQAQYDALVSGGTVDPNTFYVITDAQGADLSNYYTKSETSGATQISTALNAKQDTLSAGTGIDITNNVISATGGGGSITIDTSLDSGSTNAVANSAVSAALNYSDRFLYRVESVKSWDNHPTGEIQLRWRNPYNGSTGTTQVVFTLMKINNIPLIADYVSGIYNLNLVEASAITTSISSSSTDAQVPSAKAVHDQLGGMKIVKLTESEYTALVTKDSNTLYCVVPDPSN